MISELGSAKRFPFVPPESRKAPILAANTGRSYEEIARDTERDNYMTAQEAKEYGLIDEILAHH